MSRLFSVADLNLKCSRANAKAAVPERQMIPAEEINETLIEFQNQSSGGVSALMRRFSPVAALTTSSKGIPRMNFQ
jgi:hypothetical protein